MKLYLYLLLFTGAALPIHAQVEVVKTPFKWLNVRNDRNYIVDYTRKLNVRVFGLSKFTQYSLGVNKNGERLHYKSNDNFNLGVGFNYRFLGLNVGFKMPFVNDDARRFGKTRSFDLQSFLYMRRLTIDLYMQFYNGLYIFNQDALMRQPAGDVFPRRPDMKTRNFGINGHYIFNPRRFSYRAAFIQNEHQKKSAGSAIAGANLYHFRVSADSAVVPRDIIFSSPFWADTFNRSNVTSLAVGGGYAYTLVIKKNYFLTGSFMGALGLNYTSLRNKEADNLGSGLGLNVNGTLRLAAGYNSRDYFASIQYLHYTSRYAMPEPQVWQQFQTGSFRLTVGKRITLSKRVEKQVQQTIENVSEEVEDIIR